MMLLADVTLSTESVVVVGAVLGAVASALVWVSRVMLTWRDDQIRDLRQQRDDLLRVVYRHGLAQHVPDSVPHSALPPPRPPRE